ncbi:MAG: hypothetical protein SLAVMIC_00518 [uncultured marine phage]|uniref:Uncharacterized protein n=1 Tax=uncultured marine phage TaxID=707152 RepID=A0A8D9CD70_9VIRU|nr:MAG: hypothetical protein SLAVMIC_00518 [uncultured marine phage]
MKKFSEKVNEAYEMDIERGDMATEHAKEVISNFIDGENDDITFQGAFNRMYEDSLEGIGGPNDDDNQSIVIEAMIEYLNELLIQANNLNINE